jgi:ATP-dependent DNA helicase RecQ
LLHYFGELLDGPCGNCDTCLMPASQWDATLASKLALSAAYRTGQIFGVAHLIDVLTGKETDKVRKFSHQKLKLFGLGKDFDLKAWRAIFRQLIAMRLFRVEMESFGALKLTKDCASILRGEQQIWLRKLADKKKVTKPTSIQMVNKSTPNNDLFLILRALRQQLAKEQGVPPYVIFHDRTLLEICDSQPKSLEDLGKLHGIGEQKLKKYGQIFLKAVKDFKTFQPNVSCI